MTATSTRAIVMFARPPVAGKVKTRLSPVFSAEEALRLYEAMLADGIERMTRAAEGSATPFVCWSDDPPAPAGDLAEVLRATQVEYQMGADLGERLTATFQEKLKKGFRQVAIIGSDAPSMPIDYLDQTFEALMAVDIVVGPADDGGYYLIGARRLHPELFRRMPWGTDRVLAITRQRIKAGRVTCHELPHWYDVDTPASVGRLWRDLQHMKAKGLEELPRRTFRALAGMVPGRSLG